MISLVLFYHENLEGYQMKVLNHLQHQIINPSLNFVGTKARVKFSTDCLKQEKITYYHGKIVNIYIVYEI